MATKLKNEPICVVKIGYRQYLMRSSIGMKVVQLMAGAVDAEMDFGGSDTRYIAGEQVDVEYRSVRNNQIVMPAGEPKPVRRRLTQQRLLLESDS